MPNNPNELTIDNSLLVLIDHQPWVAFSVLSIDRGLMINNTAFAQVTAGLVKAPDFASVSATAGAR